MKVPLLDLKPQYEQIRAEVEPALLELCKSQVFILGQKVQECEAAIAKYCGAATAIKRQSGPIRTAIISCCTLSPSRTPAS